MHAKSNSFKINTRAAVIFSLALTALMIIIGGGLYLGSRTSSTMPGQETVQVVQQPATAAQVAQSEKCTNFKNVPLKAGSGFGTITVGNCYVNGEKYAINTFATPAVRDSWLKASEPYGVVPKWETATSVTYPSVTN
jgi:hypothetical protein